MTPVRSGEALAITVALDIASYADAVFWRIESATGQAILAEVALDTANILEGKVELAIPGNLLTLAAGESKALRRVILRYKSADETAGLWREAETPLLVQSLQELSVQVNSFMTYGEALLLSTEITGLSGFESGDKATRLAALTEAWTGIVRLRFDLDIGRDRFSFITDWPGRNPGNLAEVSAASYLLLDARFIKATRRAQLLEADWLLSRGSDPREMGLVSKKVGESTDVFRQGTSATLGNAAISRRTLQALAGWLDVSPRLTRA